ncbi:alpha/beta hydrolase [uncultured Shewanella sp.]|uniref:alpha/beta fold hydrolase n=1 Tax=uncultured Shewanella sp. TaxID=173975 RepID=UPI0026234D27|nr:alpha/beta hydrolase [uncultured Shewanella sp.]
MNSQAASEYYFYTDDGVKLHYIDIGKGTPIVMIPAWSQSVNEFIYQIQDMSDRYRMISLDMRGHGKSEKVDYGYRIPRLAKDLQELLLLLKLDHVVLVGHAMGASIMWCYWDLFGGSLLTKMVSIDMPSILLLNPKWSGKNIMNYGPLTNAAGAIEIMNIIDSPKGEHYRQVILNCMISQDISPNKRQAIIQSRRKLPLSQAAQLFFSNFHLEWSDIFPRVTLPCLVVSGRASLTAWSSQQWIAEQLPQSKLVFFEEDEGGKHFMFLENPDKFNRILDEFIQS